VHVNIVKLYGEQLVCETDGLNLFGTCLANDRAHMARLLQHKPWLHNADVIMFAMPPAFLQLVSHLAKATILWVAVPPEYGRQSNATYPAWLADFRAASQQRHTAIVAASEYDRMYVDHFYGVDIDVISLPVDHLLPATNATVSRQEPLVGLFPKSTWSLDWVDAELRAPLNRLAPLVEFDTVKPDTYSFADRRSDTHRFDALVYVPYMRNTNLLMEAYRSNIPILTPSLDYLVRLDQAHCLVSNRVYWTRTPEPCVSRYPHSPATLMYDQYPAVVWPEPHAFWLNASQQFAADMPGIIYFDSPDDLVHKLMTANLDAARAVMARQNEASRRDIYASWVSVIDRVVAAMPCDEAGTHPERASWAQPGLAAGAHPDHASGAHPKRASGAHPERAFGAHSELASGSRPQHGEPGGQRPNGVCATGRQPFAANATCSGEVMGRLYESANAADNARRCGVRLEYEHMPKRLSCGSWDESVFG